MGANVRMHSNVVKQQLAACKLAQGPEANLRKQLASLDSFAGLILWSDITCSASAFLSFQLKCLGSLLGMIFHPVQVNHYKQQLSSLLTLL